MQCINVISPFITVFLFLILIYIDDELTANQMQPPAGNILLSSAGAGIKAQVCSLVELLVTTLFQAYAVFYMPPEGGHKPGDCALTCGILFSTLENVTSTVPAGESQRKSRKNVES